MPPPPLNPQGSRAGLITAVVVLSILFVTSAIFAFYFSADASKNQKVVEQRDKTINQYANAEAQSDPNIARLLEGNTGKSAIQVLNEQHQELSKKVTGSANPTPPAVDQATAWIKDAGDKQGKALGINLSPNGSLMNAMKMMLDRMVAMNGELQAKDTQLADSTKKLEAEIALRKSAVEEAGKKFDEQGTKLASAMEELETIRKSNEGTVTKVQGEVTRSSTEIEKRLAKLTDDVRKKDDQISKLEGTVKVLEAKVPHPQKTNEPLLRQADGRIARVPGNDNVFIDLGQGDGIAPGLTFEVYDRFAGVPGPGGQNDLTDTKNDLPKGKAAIEVIRVGPQQSEARIIRQTRGTPVVEGDIIANLVYDRNVKYNFVVFGDFDLDNSGTPKPSDAEVIKRLITQWGGKVMNEVNVNTDVIVLGTEPEVPVREENENAQDIARRAAAEAAYQAYQDVVSRAKTRNIPILNQPRFLYYVGYFEQSKR